MVARCILESTTVWKLARSSTGRVRLKIVILTLVRFRDEHDFESLLDTWMSALACTRQLSIHRQSLIIWHNDCHRVPTIAAQPVPDDRCTGRLWVHHARRRQIHAMGAAIMERVRDAMRKQTAGSRAGQILIRNPAPRQQRMPWHGFI